MAAFKNEKNGTWYVQFRYTDWKGERQQKVELQDYKLLRKVFGSKQIDDMLKQAKEITQSKQRGSRFRNYKDER